MNLDQLRRGFFGYQKADVYQYISSLEEEFSAKLMEKDEENKKIEEQYKERVIQMEQELKEARQKLGNMMNEQMMIGAALMEAKRYSEQLKKEAESDKEKARAELEEQVEQSRNELERYRKQIASVRDTFENMLKNMDEKAEKLEIKVEELKEDYPGRNMSLFERKSETDE